MLTKSRVPQKTREIKPRGEYEARRRRQIFWSSLLYALPWSQSGLPHKTHQLRDAQAKNLSKNWIRQARRAKCTLHRQKTHLETSGCLAAKAGRSTAHPSWEATRQSLRSRKQSPIASNIVAGQEPKKASSKPTAHCVCSSSTGNLD